MIGTALIETLVQATALTHRLKGWSRVSLLLLAAPESGKTTITTAATCAHVCRVAMITGRSILKELSDHPHTEFLLFNDLSSIRAMSAPAVQLLINLLNQLTQNERGLVAFAGKETEHITRPVGVIGCLPFTTFIDHRARWKEVGFISRMVPFSYAYHPELVTEIKDVIDSGRHKARLVPGRPMPRPRGALVEVTQRESIARRVRSIADARAIQLDQLGLRLLQNYHALIRAHALLNKRHEVSAEDLDFLREIDAFVSITKSRTLSPIAGNGQEIVYVRKNRRARRAAVTHAARA